MDYGVHYLAYWEFYNETRVEREKKRCVYMCEYVYVWRERERQRDGPCSEGD